MKSHWGGWETLLVKSYCLDNSGLTPSLRSHASLNSVSDQSEVSKTLFHIMFSYCKIKMNYETIFSISRAISISLR